MLRAHVIAALSLAGKILFIALIASSAFLLILVRLSFGQGAAQSGPLTTMGYYWILHEGRDIQVYGFVDKGGNVEWKPGDSRNARPRERRTKSQGEPERIPTAEIVTPGRPQPKAIEPTNPTPEAKTKSEVKGPNWETNGVMRPALSADSRYTTSGEPSKRFVAEIAETAAPKMHLTIIGNADERARVVNDIQGNAEWSDLRDKLYVQDYDLKDWPVDPKLGFRPGKPAIIVQTAKGPNDPKGGRVIYRTQDYSMGSVGLAEEVRKADPDYNPDRDPGPHNPNPNPPNPGPITPNQPWLPKLNEFEGTYLAIAVLIALALLIPKKGK